MKRLRIWKLGILMATLGGITVVTSYLESFAIESADDVASQACLEGLNEMPACAMGLIGGWGLRLDAPFGALIAITFVVYAYTYALKGISVYLPWYVSIAVSGFLFFVAKFQAPVDRLLVDVLAYAYPAPLRETYVATAVWGAPVASALMKVSTLIVVGTQIWVVGRLGMGLLRYGDAYKASKPYRKWSEVPESVPGVFEVFSEYFTQVRSRAKGVSRYGSNRKPVAASSTGSKSRSRELSPLGRTSDNPRAQHVAQRHKKAKARRASRAARKARRVQR